MDDLDSVVKRTIEDLNSFDAGFDENDITGFITKVLNNANENIDKGAYGNNVMANYMQKIFGDFDYNGPSEGYGEAYKAWLKNNVAWLEANKDNMKSAWSDFASTLDNQMLGAAQIYEKDGEIILNANGMTTQQLIDAMTATGKVTKTQAEMMIADFKNYSADFKHEMAENDLPNAIKGWMDAVVKTGGFYDEADITRLSNLLGIAEPKIRDTIKKLQQDSEEYKGIEFKGLTWTDKDGNRTKDSILNALSQTGKTISRWDIDPSTGIANKLFNYDQIKQAYSDLGIPQMFESDFNQILQAGDSFQANLFGNTETITIEEGKTAGEAYAQAYQEAVNQNLADKLGATLGDKFGTVLKDIFTDTEIDIDTTKAISSLQGVNEELDETSKKVDEINSKKITFDTEGAKDFIDGVKEFFSSNTTDEQTKAIADKVPDIHALGAASNEVESAAGAAADSVNDIADAASGAAGGMENAAQGTQDLVSGLAQGKEAANQVDKAIEDIPKNPQIQIDVIYNELNRPAPIESPQYVSVIYSPSGETGATGGLVGSYAKGSENFHVKPGTALTGEEGPEIVWNKEKGYSYITGSDGPEFQDLKPGDRVFNASETKKILKNSSAANGGKVDSYAEGYGDAKASSKKGSGGKDKDKTSAEWKNELDWLYNLMENIVELERDQKKLEEEYEDILTDQAKTSKDLYSLLIERLGNLNAQLDRQTLALQKREQEMREFMDTTNDKDQYLWYNWNDRTIEIDWDKIEAIKDEEEYKHIKDLVSEAEAIQDKMDDAEDAITDIENQIQELENIWRDTYVDFEKRVLDALVQSYQDVIDNYSELNETLNNTNDEILNAIQQQIDLERQIRDNTETEDDISQKEARLAYLQRDTTGANATEILKLQEELENSRKDYEDTLVDQALQRLQEDNDAAAQQREKQIEFMQAQLEYSKKNGDFNDKVTELLTGALSTEGTLITTSDLRQLLIEEENWKAMSDINKQIWEEELNETFKQVGAQILKENAGDVFSTKIQEMTTSILERFDTLIGSKSQSKTKNTSSKSSGSGGGGDKSKGGKPTKQATGPKDGETRQVTGKDGTVYLQAYDAYTKTWETVKIISKPKSTPSTTKKNNAGKAGCFAPGTKVLMDNFKIKNIEDIKINDMVIAFDEETNTFVPKKVIKSYVHHDTPAIVKLNFANKTNLYLTPGHPLYSTDGWKSLDIENSWYEHGTIATLLKVGDEIININGNSIVTSIEWMDIGLNYDSYNIEVEDCHTFLANGYVAHNAKVSMYATGGLNTSSGLAWLDGTPSEPEYVLNARQTQAFLKLADVLPNVMSGNTQMNGALGGNIYLDLDMHVDEIGSDYDVDRIANRVKDIIYDASSYRNVNTINFIR